MGGGLMLTSGRRALWRPNQSASARKSVGGWLTNLPRCATQLSDPVGEYAKTRNLFVCTVHGGIIEK